MTFDEMKDYLAKKNAMQPDQLAMVPKYMWPSYPEGLVEVWRNKTFLVQIYIEAGLAGYERISVTRTTKSEPGDRWDDGISWDELQQIKRECGRGYKWAVEIYPEDSQIVNVANMRHIWVLPMAPEYGWRKGVRIAHGPAAK